MSATARRLSCFRLKVGQTRKAGSVLKHALAGRMSALPGRDMRNRASTHLLLLLLVVGLEVVGYWAVYDSALLRGYEPSIVGAARDLLLYVPLLFLLFWFSRAMRFKGNWTLYTTAVLLFSVGLLVQYRLYSDPEYGSGNKAQARAEKTQVQRLRYIN